MSNYDQIKKLLRNAEALADKNELEQADACVRASIKFGCCLADISHNLTSETMRKLREYTGARDHRE